MSYTISNIANYKNYSSSIFEELLKKSIYQAVTNKTSNFTKICGMEPRYLQEENTNSCDSLAVVISFMGELSFSVIFILPKQTANYFASKLVGFDIAYDSPDMMDIVGEILNIFAGSLTDFLERQQIVVQMSLPSVVQSDYLESLLPIGFLSFCLYFLIEDFPFSIKVITTQFE